MASTTHAERKERAREQTARLAAHLAARLGPLATAELFVEAAKGVLAADLERAHGKPRELEPAGRGQ